MAIEFFGGDAAHALLGKYLPKPMQERVNKAAMKAGKAVVPLVRREINSSIAGHGQRPGTLARRVTARRSAASALTTVGGLGAVQVKSTAPHSHLVIRGHRIVSHAGRDTGRQSRPNPFIDRTEPEARVVARAIMEEEIFRG